MSDDDRQIGVPPDWRIDNSQIFPMWILVFDPIKFQDGESKSIED